MSGDVLSLESDNQPGEPLLQLVMRGRPTYCFLTDVRREPSACGARPRSAAGAFASIGSGCAVSGLVADALMQLATEVDSRLAQHERARA